jgi:hypothetical protein
MKNIGRHAYDGCAARFVFPEEKAMRSWVAVLLLVITPALAGQREERTWGELANLVNRQIPITTP